MLLRTLGWGVGCRIAPEATVSDRASHCSLQGPCRTEFVNERKQRALFTGGGFLS